MLIESPVFFVTICTIGRKRALANRTMALMLTDNLRRIANRHNWRIGRYVVMPDHVHFFCGSATDGGDLSRFVGGLKEATTRAAWGIGWSGRLWQREFFDHLLRSHESYDEKWEYVRRNPVRAGLCADPEDWMWQGELTIL